jgi:hypothetical protein
VWIVNRRLPKAESPDGVCDTVPEVEVGWHAECDVLPAVHMVKELFGAPVVEHRRNPLHISSKPAPTAKAGASGPSPTVDFSDGGFCEPTEPCHHPFGPERRVPLPRGLLVDLTARCRIACGKIILQQPMDEHIAAANLTEENALGGIVQEIYVTPRH